MTGSQVFTSRLRGRPLLDSDGLAIGRVRDVVILPAAGQRSAARARPGRDAAAAPHLRQPRPDHGDIRRRGAPARRHRRPRPLHPADRGDPRLGAVRPAHRGPGPSSTSPSAPASSRGTAGRSPRSPSRTAGACWHRGPTIVPVGQAPGAVRGRPAGRAAGQPARDAAGRPGHRRRGAAAQPGAASSRPRSTTRNWPTCWRRCRNRTRSGCWTASSSSAAPTWSRRWSPTTPPTCSARCRPSSANGC